AIVEAPIPDWGAEFLAWQRGFSGDGNPDRDVDGDVDGHDFLAWQRDPTPAATASLDEAFGAWEQEFADGIPALAAQERSSVRINGTRGQWFIDEPGDVLGSRTVPHSSRPLFKRLLV
ncbi:MAG: hypothetical protein KDA61_09860, partial [Planctomycetales bacterium]|nr:hypothetical protein [Planctomycetales bacterium]